MSLNRFYTRDDFDVRFSAAIQKGSIGFYHEGKRIGLGKIGEAPHVEKWDELRFNPADRWLCPETPQERRKAATS